MSKKKLTFEAQKILDALLEKSKCPHCKARLHEDNISWTEDGEQTYRLTLVVGKIKNRLNYSSDEFHNKGIGGFYCRSCGEMNDLTEKEVIRILQLHHAS